MRKQSKRIAIILLIIMITGFIITFNIITANAATTFDSLKSKYQTTPYGIVHISQAEPLSVMGLHCNWAMS